MTEKRFASLKEFYPFYLTEHQNLTSRILHFMGTALLILAVIAAILFHDWRFLVAVPFIGYGFAWVGHFFSRKINQLRFSIQAIV